MVHEAYIKLAGEAGELQRPMRSVERDWALDDEHAPLQAHGHAVRFVGSITPDDPDSDDWRIGADDLVALVAHIEHDADLHILVIGVVRDAGKTERRL